MNRPSRRALLAPLFAVVALLLGLTGIASAAFNHEATEAPLGNFLLWEVEASGFAPLELADPSKEIGEWVYDDALGVPVYVRQNPWTFFDPLGLMSEHETKWQARAQDESRGFFSRAGAAFMSAAEGLNVFRSDSSIRQGGRQLDAGLAEGRANLKKNAPPVVREIGQVALGVGKTGSLGMNAAGLAEFGETAIQQGVVETGKNMATGLVEGIRNDPVETLSSFATPSALAKATLGNKTARATHADAQAEAGRVFWSGSREAKAAAEGFAKESGGTTLEMTLAGKVLDKVTTKQTYPLMKPLWDRASKNFAKGASGSVDVFHSSRGVRLESVWATKEYPVLFERGNPMNYHVTD